MIRTQRQALNQASCCILDDILFAMIYVDGTRISRSQQIFTHCILAIFSMENPPYPLS